MNYEVCRGNYEVLGVHTQGNVTSFSVRNTERKKCVLVLYPKGGGDVVRIPMQPDENQTQVYAVGLKNLSADDLDYTFELDGATVWDPYAECIAGREQWGEISRKQTDVKCRKKSPEKFSWGDDRLPQIHKEDMVMYRLHVRGFTQLAKLPEEEKGTFRGLERKLPYLQELGVTTLELMPVYEFEEVFAADPCQKERFPAEKINYWGYTGGNYFAVKSSYLGKGKTGEAFRQLVRRLHQRNMECILEFYFEPEENPCFILEVLRYWAGEYHVDGFHVICSPQAAEMAARDYRLGGRKLFFHWFSPKQCEKGRHEMQLFSYNDAFLYGIRKFMNDPRGNLREFADQMKRQETGQGFVNYLAGNNGFCLYDTFAYTEKQNRANGEENRDGTDWNFSCNCGEEGPSRKSRVNRLREKQIKNAMCTLMFAQGVPLLWMGDESGNTQGGNNNAYCQDNEVGWKDWSQTKLSRELLTFWKQLAAIRRQFPVLRNPMPMKMSDYLGFGYPDLSYHGENGWWIDMDRNQKTIGMMYTCGYGAKAEEKKGFLYAGYNFSTAGQTLALPTLPPQYSWQVVLTTEPEAAEAGILTEGSRTFSIPAQSVCLLKAEPEETI